MGRQEVAAKGCANLGTSVGVGGGALMAELERAYDAGYADGCNGIATGPVGSPAVGQPSGFTQAQLDQALAAQATRLKSEFQEQLGKLQLQEEQAVKNALDSAIASTTQPASSESTSTSGNGSVAPSTDSSSQISPAPSSMSPLPSNSTASTKVSEEKL